MEFGWIGVIVAVIAATYCLTKYFIEDKQKMQDSERKEWGNSPSASTPTQNELQGFYLDIYNHCIYHIVTYENQHNIDLLAPYRIKAESFLLKYNNRPDAGSADKIALTLLWNLTTDDLKCGAYHFHIGSLTPEGESVLQFSLHCLEAAEGNGYVSNEDAAEARSALFQSIREAG